MKIGFFTNNYLPINYGSTTSILSFRQGLEELGHEVFIFAPKFWGYEDELPNVFRYPSMMVKYKINFPIPLSFWPPMSVVIGDLGLDIIHAHHPFSIGKAGLRHAKKLRIPAVFTHHCRYEDYVHYTAGVPKKWLKSYVKKAATNFANDCDFVIAPTESVRKIIVSRGINKPSLALSTGISWDRFQKGKRKETRKRYDIKKNETLIMYLGRVEEEKNIWLMAKATKRIIQKYPKAKMMWVGGGSLVPKIKKWSKKENLEEKTIIANLVPHEDVHHFYSAADIFLQASVTDTQGMTLNESMSAGRAVVAVNATGSMDLIENGKTGILTKNNAKDFGVAIESLIKERKKRIRLGESARLAMKELDYKKQAKKLEKVYLKLLENKK